MFLTYTKNDILAWFYTTQAKYLSLELILT